MPSLKEIEEHAEEQHVKWSALNVAADTKRIARECFCEEIKEMGKIYQNLGGLCETCGAKIYKFDLATYAMVLEKGWREDSIHPSL